MSEGRRLIETLRDVVAVVPLVYGGSRECSIAVTHLETALLWIEHGIATGAIAMPPDKPAAAEAAR